MGASQSKSPGSDKNRRLRTPKPSRSEKRLEKQLLSQRQKQSDAFKREEAKKQSRLNNSSEFNRGILEARNEDAPLLALSKTTGFSLMLLRRLQVLFDVISCVVVHDNTIDVFELSTALRLPSESLLFRAIFKLFDVTQTRSVNFRTWVITLSALSTHANFHTKLRFSFRLLDLNDDGIIERSEVIALLESIIRHKTFSPSPSMEILPTSTSTSSFPRILSSSSKSPASPPPKSKASVVTSSGALSSPPALSVSSQGSQFVDDFLLNLDLTSEEIEAFVGETMDAADADGDGSISYHEYELIMRSSQHFYNAFSIDIEAVCSSLAHSYVGQAIIIPDDVAIEREKLFRSRKGQRQIHGSVHAYGHHPTYKLLSGGDASSQQSATSPVQPNSQSTTIYDGNILVKSASITSTGNDYGRSSVGLSVASTSYQQQFMKQQQQQQQQHQGDQHTVPAMSASSYLAPPPTRSVKSHDIGVGVGHSTTLASPQPIQTPPLFPSVSDQVHPMAQQHTTAAVSDSDHHTFPPLEGQPQPNFHRPLSGGIRPSSSNGSIHASPNPFTPGHGGFTPKDNFSLVKSASTIGAPIDPQPGVPLGLPFHASDDDYELYDGSQQPFSSLTRSKQINPHLADPSTPEGFHMVHFESDVALDMIPNPAIHPDLLPAIGEESQVFHRTQSGQIITLDQGPIPHSLSHVPSNLSVLSVDPDCFLTTVVPQSDIIIFTDNSIEDVKTIIALEDLDVEDPEEQTAIARETYAAPALAKLLAAFRDEHTFD